MGDWDLVHIQKRRRIISKIPQSLNQWEEERGRERERDGHASRGLIFTVDQYRSTYIQGSLIPERGAADRYQEKHGVWVGGRWHLEVWASLTECRKQPWQPGLGERAVPGRDFLPTEDVTQLFRRTRDWPFCSVDERQGQSPCRSKMSPAPEGCLDSSSVPVPSHQSCTQTSPKHPCLASKRESAPL